MRWPGKLVRSIHFGQLQINHAQQRTQHKNANGNTGNSKCCAGFMGEQIRKDFVPSAIQQSVLGFCDLHEYVQNE